MDPSLCGHASPPIPVSGPRAGVWRTHGDESRVIQLHKNYWIQAVEGATEAGKTPHYWPSKPSLNPTPPHPDPPCSALLHHHCRLFLKSEGGGDPGVSVLSEFPLDTLKLFLKWCDDEQTLDTIQWPPPLLFKYCSLHLSLSLFVWISICEVHWLRDWCHTPPFTLTHYDSVYLTAAVFIFSQAFLIFCSYLQPFVCFILRLMCCLFTVCYCSASSIHKNFAFQKQIAKTHWTDLVENH